MHIYNHKHYTFELLSFNFLLVCLSGVINELQVGFCISAILLFILSIGESSVIFLLEDFGVE